MLVVRSVLLLGFGLNIFGDPDRNNFLITVVLTCLIVGTGIRGIVYKCTLFHITENVLYFKLDNPVWLDNLQQA